MASNYLHEHLELNQFKTLSAKELADRDMKIARLVSYQTSSPTDLLGLAKKISAVLDSAPDRHREFFEKALPEAMHIQITYGIPASAVLAQAIYESGYGRSMLAMQYHNYFGIKAFNTWDGMRAKAMPTKDLGVATTADFRAYKTMRDGFIGYAEFLKETGRYDNAFHTQSGLEFIQKILADGYCPDESYLDNIRRIMERHKLMELDRILENTTSVAMKQANTIKQEFSEDVAQAASN
jgi:flagellar protein FlgJ